MRTYKFKRNNEIVKAIGSSEAQVRKRLDLCFEPEPHQFFQVESSHLIYHFLTFIGTSKVGRGKFQGNLDRVSRTNKPLTTWAL